MESKFHSATIRRIPYEFNFDKVTFLKTSFNLHESNEAFLYIGTFESNIFDFKYLRKAKITYGNYEDQYFREEKEIIKETNFQLDLQKKLIIVYAGKLRSSFLIRRLENRLNLLIPFLELTFYSIFNLIDQPSFITQSEQVIIKNFEHDLNLIGTYIVDIHDNETLKLLIGKYGNNIQKMKLSIQDYEENITYLTIDKSGSFLFRGSNEQNKLILNYLINSILERE